MIGDRLAGRQYGALGMLRLAIILPRSYKRVRCRLCFWGKSQYRSILQCTRIGGTSVQTFAPYLDRRQPSDISTSSFCSSQNKSPGDLFGLVEHARILCIYNSDNRLSFLYLV